MGEMRKIVIAKLSMVGWWLRQLPLRPKRRVIRIKTIVVSTRSQGFWNRCQFFSYPVRSPLMIQMTSVFAHHKQSLLVNGALNAKSVTQSNIDVK